MYGMTSHIHPQSNTFREYDYLSIPRLNSNHVSKRGPWGSVKATMPPANEDSLHNPTDHDDVIKWKHFPRYWPFVRGIRRSLVNSPHKAQWRGALMFYLICAWINGWVNNRKAGDLRRHRDHYDATVMIMQMMRVGQARMKSCQSGIIFINWLLIVSIAFTKLELI